MEEKKVSIVLPVYNGTDHVASSIESIIAQTYQNWELIIVNDCSTDNTLEICRRYEREDGRVRVISNPVNCKLPNSLNAGFYAATGDYYTWTSDDNKYRPNAIEVLVNTLQSNPDLVMAYSDYTNIDGDGNVIAAGKLQDPQFIVTGNVFGACFLYTAEVAKQVGIYDANLFLAEDYDYWMRIYRHGKVKHISDDLYLYRRHAGSLTETKKASINEQTYKALEKNFLPLYEDAKKHHLAYAFFDHILVRAEAHRDDTKAMLISVDGGYNRFLKRRSIKGLVGERIRNTIIYRVLQKLKKEKTNGAIHNTHKG